MRDRVIQSTHAPLGVASPGVAGRGLLLSEERTWAVVAGVALCSLRFRVQRNRAIAKELAKLKKAH